MYQDDQDNIILGSSRDSDDSCSMDGGYIDPQEDPLMEAFPEFTSQHDILEEEEVWISDCLSDFDNILTMARIFESVGLKCGQSRLTGGARTKVIALLQDQDFIECLAGDFDDTGDEEDKTVRKACDKLVSVLWKIVKKLIALTEGTVSGQAADPNLIFKEWDNDVLQLFYYQQENRDEAVVSSSKERPMKKRRITKPEAKPDPVIVTRHNERPPEDATITRSPNPGSTQAHGVDNRTIPRSARNDLARSRDERHLGQLRDYTGSLRVAANYISRETFLMYPRLGSLMDDFEQGFKEDIFDSYSRSLAETTAVLFSGEDVHQLEVLRLVERIRNFEVVTGQEEEEVQEEDEEEEEEAEEEEVEEDHTDE